MNTVPVQDFVPRIAPLIDGCPDFSIRRAVSDTVLELCRDALNLTTATCFATTRGKQAYRVPMPDGLTVEMVKHCYVFGRQLRPVTVDEINHKIAPMDPSESSGVPLYYSFAKPGVMTLWPVPDGKYLVKCAVAVGIERDGENIPELFFQDYLDAVVYGALARLYKTAGQGYSNFRLAAEYDVLFKQAAQGLYEDSVRDYSRTAGRVLFNRWVN